MMRLFLTLFVLLLPAQARWAGSFVLTPAGLEGSEHPRAPKVEPPSMKFLENGDLEIQITPSEPTFGKQWYVVTAIRRLKGKDRHLELPITLWKNMEGMEETWKRLITAQEEFAASMKDEAQRKKQEAHNRVMEKNVQAKIEKVILEDVKPLPDVELKPKVVTFVIPKKNVDRTYLFFGFPPGSMVIDGGERITVDLPAFADKLGHEK